MKSPVPLTLSALFGFALSAGLFLLGCARRETPVEAGIRTQTLLVGNNAEPASLDPHLATMITDQSILLALFEGLTALDEKTARPVPAVAERWDISPDGLVYTFHLRPTAHWSNGDPVTAHDFAFAFQRVLLPRLGAPSAYMLWSIKNAEAFNAGKLADFSAVGVEAVDAVTLRLTLERPTPYLPALAAHTTWMPLHRSTLEKFRAVDDRNAAWTRPGALVGNGAFTLAEWRPNDRIIVTKNPYYWDAGHNRLERVVFFPTESPDVEERNFRAGQMHLTTGIPIQKIARYRERKPAWLRVDPLFATWYLCFNVTKPPLDNPKVRRALALAIDREAIVRSVFANSRRPAVHFTPPDLAGYTARARVPTDFAAARRLLAEAGFPGGEGLPEIEVQADNYVEQPKTAEAIQEMWRRELGVRLRIAVLEAKTKMQNRQTKSYTVSFAMWNADFADPASFLEVFVTNGGNNVTGWSHPGYDRLIADASRTLDQDRRFEMFQQAEALLLEEASIAPLYFDAQTYLIHPTVKNWEPAVLGFHRYQRVWLEP
jgi:oligopeptide transport system substrate-binding protein